VRVLAHPEGPGTAVATLSGRLIRRGALLLATGVAAYAAVFSVCLSMVARCADHRDGAVRVVEYAVADRAEQDGPDGAPAV
jgi:hypothetical protein